MSLVGRSAGRGGLLATRPCVCRPRPPPVVANELFFFLWFSTLFQPGEDSEPEPDDESDELIYDVFLAADAIGLDFA